VAPLHLVGYRRRNVIEGEEARFLGHAGMKDNLKEKIAELVL
jgi:hypothetical protein